MKDYLSQYLKTRAGSSVSNTKGDELTELTKPDLSEGLKGSVSFVSDQPLEYREIDEDVAWRVEAMLPQIPTMRRDTFFGSSRTIRFWSREVFKVR